MFKGIRPEFQCLGGIRSECQSLQRYGQNSNVWKNKDRIPMFQKIRTEYQCLERKDQNSDVWKDKDRIPMFRKIRPEF